ncbi:unnamed protein product, partial [Ascophyllum nodosum]
WTAGCWLARRLHQLKADLLLRTLVVAMLMEVNGNIRVLARVRPMVEVSETQADG